MGFVQRRLLKAVLRVVAWPKLTLLLCGLALIFSIGLSKTRLSLSTSQNELMTPELPFFKEYLKYISYFPESESFVVVIQPKNYDAPNLAQEWMLVADEIAASLRSLKQDVRRVDYRVRPDSIGEQGLMFSTTDDVHQQSAEIKRMLPLLKVVGEKPGLDALILGTNPTQRMLTALSKGDPAEAQPMVEWLASSLNSSLSTDPASWQRGAQLPDMTQLDPRMQTDPARAGYFVVKDQVAAAQGLDRTLLVLNVYSIRDFSKLSDVTKPLERMRAAVKDVIAKHPNFDAAITGRPAMEADEMATSDWDTKKAEILGLSLVFVALLVMLRSLWLVIATEICLGVSIAWTFGWATLSIGRLNLLSLVFVIALIGIGIDYLIQIATRYRYEAKRYSRPKAIWARVFRYVSPPISTACCGAAGAFFVSALTEFRGAAELGIIAGGGLLLCLLSGYTVLPALLTVFPPTFRKVDEADRYTDVRDLPPAGGKRLIAPLIWIIVAIAGLVVALPPRFDPDLIGLQAQKEQSVLWVRKISTWNAVVLSSDLDQLRIVRDAVTPKPGKDAESSTIARTESVIDAIDHQRWLVANNADLRSIKWIDFANDAGNVKPVDLKNVAKALDQTVAEWKRKGADVTRLSQLAQQLSAAAADPESEQKLARFAAWQRALLTELQSTLAMFTPGELTPTKLPPEMRDHFVSDKKGPPVYALYIHPKYDGWHTDELEKFVAEIDSRVPKGTVVTGIAPQLLESTKSIHDAFLKSAVYALLLIVILVWIDMRKWTHTLLAVSVLALGLPMLLLFMWFWRALGNPFGITGSWNFANFFALPILIGAGHEYGVFLVHRYKEVLADPRRVWGYWDVSDRALLLCAVVTSSAFGFLMIAQHRGLRSLGWVMAVGTMCIYLASLIVLRPLLQWRLKQQKIYTPPEATPPKSS